MESPTIPQNFANTLGLKWTHQRRLCHNCMHHKELWFGVKIKERWSECIAMESNAWQRRQAMLKDGRSQALSHSNPVPNFAWGSLQSEGHRGREIYTVYTNDVVDTKFWLNLSFYFLVNMKMLTTLSKISIVDVDKDPCSKCGKFQKMESYYVSRGGASCCHIWVLSWCHKCRGVTRGSDYSDVRLTLKHYQHWNHRWL